ncbi:MAG: DNA-binding protein [Candidatus Marinimicrobia bacterium]|jgi:hypothetical protein|nr:DNA-binding protein [Candidatus Neomarinimicrobiota bacterium]MDP6936171.1 DNA-binding protein [Candidatus Neomarinimicrobiota bacterium]
MTYRKDGSTIYISLDKGDPINATFEKFAVDEGIRCAWLNGIGALEDPEIGYFSSETKSYHRQQFKGEYELTSLMGNITMKDGKQFSHTHITISDTECRVFGGHLFEAKIALAGEFIMQPGSGELNRKLNADMGLSVWCLEKCGE